MCLEKVKQKVLLHCQWEVVDKKNLCLQLKDTVNFHCMKAHCLIITIIYNHVRNGIRGLQNDKSTNYDCNVYFVNHGHEVEYSGGTISLSSALCCGIEASISLKKDMQSLQGRPRRKVLKFLTLGKQDEATRVVATQLQLLVAEAIVACIRNATAGMLQYGITAVKS